MASTSSTYQPRQPEQGALHQLVPDHFETFRAQAAHWRDGQGLPRFVEQEFRDFLTCGCLAAGFARFRCSDCRLDRLVPFSCKGRGSCPSCGGRRMTDRVAHLVDHVFPAVPIRQWVLTLPPRLRYLLAWDHALCPGEGFDITGIAHAAINNPPDDPLGHDRAREELGLRPGGLGLVMTHGLVDEVIYNEKRNEVVLVKYLD